MWLKNAYDVKGGEGYEVRLGKGYEVRVGTLYGVGSKIDVYFLGSTDDWHFV